MIWKKHFASEPIRHQTLAQEERDLIFETKSEVENGYFALGFLKEVIPEVHKALSKSGKEVREALEKLPPSKKIARNPVEAGRQARKAIEIASRKPAKFLQEQIRSLDIRYHGLASLYQQAIAYHPAAVVEIVQLAPCILQEHANWMRGEESGWLTLVGQRYIGMIKQLIEGRSQLSLTEAEEEAQMNVGGQGEWKRPNLPMEKRRELEKVVRKAWSGVGGRGKAIRLPDAYIRFVRMRFKELYERRKSEIRPKDYPNLGAKELTPANLAKWQTASTLGISTKQVEKVGL